MEVSCCSFHACLPAPPTLSPFVFSLSFSLPRACVFVCYLYPPPTFILYHHRIFNDCSFIHAFIHCNDIDIHSRIPRRQIDFSQHCIHGFDSATLCGLFGSRTNCNVGWYCCRSLCHYTPHPTAWVVPSTPLF